MGAVNKIKNRMLSIGRALTDFVYPPFCLLCESSLQHSENNVCPQCWEALPKIQPACVDSRSISIITQQECCFDSSLAVWQYTEAAQQIVHLLKYNGYRQLAKSLGQAMGKAAKETIEYAKSDCLIPVPLHRVKYREREFNQSLLLAEHASEIVKVPVQAKTMIRLCYTKPQAQLSALERHRNVGGAFALKKNVSVQGAHVVIVDDVITTGSTINECAKVLKEAGASQVMALTALRA